MKKISFNIVKKLDRFTVDVEYAFEQGVLVIQGESGAGKTTILNCISGLMCPDAGAINIGGETVFQQTDGMNGNDGSDVGVDTGRINLPARKRNVGYLFQNYALFPNMTVEQNILYGIKNKREYKDSNSKKELLDYAEYIMETFGIAHLKKRRPILISGGEKQRVALSRAIVTKPKLLLLDEPFSALDEATKEIVYKEFLLFKEKFAIPTILITHNRKESEMFADQHLHICEGCIREDVS